MATKVNTPWMKELALALAVLALVFLNFGHTNQAFAAGGRVVATTSAVCGNPFIPADGDHAPCHACRSDQAAVLPDPPTGHIPGFYTVFVPYFVAANDLFTGPAAPRAAQPRAPPVLI